jgi:beta-glucanase (GH16 family)
MSRCVPPHSRWYFDHQLYAEVTRGQVGDGSWVFDHDFFVLLNVAVGGWFSEKSDDTLAFPRRLLVDHVSVYSPRSA